MLFDDWTVADVCGAASICCWLGAQLPYVRYLYRTLTR